MYAKLFASIYQGTLRGNAHGLLVFTNLLAHADAKGGVDIHPRAIADEVGLSESDVRTALLMLEAPDEESRSPELDGRRIVRTDEHRVWGWRIVNHAKYRGIRNEEDRREQNRIAQAEWRSKQNKPASAALSRGCAESAQAEADAEADAEERKHLSDSRTSVGSPRGKQEYSPDFQRLWTAYPNKVQKDTAYKAFLKRKPDADLTEAMVVAVTKQKKGASWTKNEGEFIPHLATWLNGGGWKDELTQPRHDDGLRGAI